MNFIQGRIDGVDGQTATIGLVDHHEAKITLPIKETPSAGASVRLGIRPEHIAMANGADFKINLRAEVTEQLGGESYIYADSQSGERLVVQQQGYSAVKAGEDVAFTFDAEQAYLFDQEGLRIR